MILLTGDKHLYDLEVFKEVDKNVPNLTKKDYVIVLGDFGLLWNPDWTPEELGLKKEIEDCSFTTLWLDGNHENFDRIDKLPEIEFCGGKAGKVSDSIIHLKRGEIYTIDGSKFFIFGGGKSIDKAYRTPGLTWWDRELPNFMEYKNGLDNLEKNNFEVDYILTHEAPSGIYHKLTEYFLIGHGREPKHDDYDLPKYLQEVFDKTNFKRWYFGHHHTNKEFGKLTCLYDTFLKLGVALPDF